MLSGFYVMRANKLGLSYSTVHFSLDLPFHHSISKEAFSAGKCLLSTSILPLNEYEISDWLFNILHSILALVFVNRLSF